ncbi:serine-threonine protein kinase, putative [Entamoeba invadens IP1]|uniref:Serine-threonine protein kinase, putative n=1 Tax=Entamoeba invadens IP1 TaxID=370355 RepID=A0A0A1U1B3_ENTIV|nr:serine-threonine protein kinase, putative [Entamoeba invadens IP1]ELP87795.1 serine-threonine protein kinase, putative [Entamoeba invadens IP1]|eukprot:XP_004254566.1 serine-threonine protein kinase, putative [Entamoeba invadens IP1]
MPHNDDIPLTLSKHMINFDKPDLIAPIFTELHDEIYVYNPTDIEYAFLIVFPTNQCIGEANPTRAVLCPKGGITLQLSIKFICGSHDFSPVLFHCSEGDGVDKDHPMYTTKLNFCVITEAPLIYDIATIEPVDHLKNTLSSVVYSAAIHTRMFIVKHFKIDWNEDARELLAKAAITLSEEKCDELVKVLGVVVSPGNESFLIEYGQYGNISTCYGRKKLDVWWMKQAFLDVLKGLEYLHTNARVHGDIKPQNIIVFSMEGNGVLCKLSDYWNIREITGIASDVISDKEMINIAIFKAPEVLKGNDPTQKSDIYSMGMCLLEVFQQHEIYKDKPFANGWDAAVKVAKGKRPNFDEGFNKNVEQIVRMCWKQDEDERPDVGKVIELVKEIEVPSNEDFDTDD